MTGIIILCVLLVEAFVYINYRHVFQGAMLMFRDDRKKSIKNDELLRYILLAEAVILFIVWKIF